MAIARMMADDRPELIDETVVANLREIFGDATGGLMSKTRAIITERMGQMRALAGLGASEALKRLAHEVAGMSSQVGLALLSFEARTLEQVSDPVNAAGPAAVAAAFARVEDAARQSLERMPQA